MRARLLRVGHLADGATRQLAERVPHTPDSAQAPSAWTLWPADSGTPQALLALLGEHRRGAREVSEGLSALFFTHSGPAAHSVSA